jgi:hypothetical protein
VLPRPEPRPLVPEVGVDRTLVVPPPVPRSGADMAAAATYHHRRNECYAQIVDSTGKIVRIRTAGVHEYDGGDYVVSCLSNVHEAFRGQLMIQDPLGTPPRCSPQNCINHLLVFNIQYMH